MKIHRFEEIQAWQESRKLVNQIYETTQTNKDFNTDYRLINQIQAAAVSTMSNIAEGFARRSNKEFIQFLFISKSSAAEVQSQLYVALDQNYINKTQFQKNLQPSRNSKQTNLRLHKIPKNQKNPINSFNPKKPNKPKELNKPNKPKKTQQTQKTSQTKNTSKKKQFKAKTQNQLSSKL